MVWATPQIPHDLSEWNNISENDPVIKKLEYKLPLNSNIAKLDKNLSSQELGYKLQKVYNDTKRNKKSSISNPQLNCSTLKTPNDIDLSLRQDVVTKTLLRAIRRVFFYEFKANNIQLFRKRIVNVPVKRLTKATKQMCERMFKHTEVNDSFVAFMQTFLRFKQVSTKNIWEESYNKSMQVEDCLFKFSMAKFKKIINIPELQACIRLVTREHKEQMFQNEAVLQNNRELYENVLDILQAYC